MDSPDKNTVTKTARHCSQCGAPLPSGSPGQRCPKCLLQFALDPAAAETGVAPDPARPRVQYFGDYELLEEIARGGVGVVWKARQVSLNRVVAVKMLLAGRFSSPDFVQRFRVEAEAAANLQHPNIVAIHEIGEHESQHYFSMDYIEGQNFSQLVRDQPLTARRAAAYLQTIAEAVQYAHQRGVVHRDLKPSNVLLDAHDQPRVTDFGLAKFVVPQGVPALAGEAPDDSRRAQNLHATPAKAGTTSGAAPAEAGTPNPDLTLSGQILGTPGYMSPEQAGGRRGAIGTASDVYSLGALLYFLITGRAPFAADSIEETLRQVLQVEPVSPRLLNPAVPRDLETICLKCLSKEPGRRYESAGALADDLQRWLNHEPIQARPPSRIYRLQKLVVRHKLAFGAAASIAVALLVGASVATWQAVRAKAAERSTRDHLYAAQISLARRAWSEGDAPGVLDLLAAQRPQPGQEDLRGFEWHYLQGLLHRERGGWRHAGDYISVGNISPQANLLAVSAPARLVDRPNLTNAHAVVLHDLRSGQIAGTLLLGAEEPVPFADCDGIFFSADGRLLATSRPGGGTNGSVLEIWEVERIIQQKQPAPQLVAQSAASLREPGTPPGLDVVIPASFPQLKPRTTFGTPSSKQLAWAAFSTDNKWIAAGMQPTNDAPECAVRVWELATGSTVHTVTNLDQWGAMPLAFSPDNRFLAINTLQGVQLWDTAFWRLHTNLALGSPVESMEFAPDSSALAVMPALVISPHHAQVWNVATAERTTFIPQRCDVLAYSPDGRRLATATGTAVQLWDARRGTVLSTFAGHTGRVDLIAFLPQTDTLLSEDATGAVKLWNVADLSEAKAWRSGDWPGFGLAPDGRSVARWDRKGGIHLQRSDGSARLVASVETNTIIPPVLWSPDGQIVVYCEFNAFDGSYGTYRVKQVATGVELLHWPAETYELDRNPTAQALFSTDGVALSDDGTKLAAASPYRDKLLLWNLGAGGAQDDSVRPFEGYVQPHLDITSFVFSPDGSKLALSTVEDTKVWNVATRRLEATLPAPESVLAFTPNGQTLAAARSHPLQTDRLILWDLATRQPRLDLGRGNMPFSALAFSPDGRTLAVATQDAKVRLWHARTGAELFTLTMPTGSADKLVFTPDSRTLVAVASGEVFRWSSE